MRLEDFPDPGALPEATRRKLAESMQMFNKFQLENIRQAIAAKQSDETIAKYHGCSPNTIRNIRIGRTYHW